LSGQGGAGAAGFAGMGIVPVGELVSVCRDEGGASAEDALETGGDEPDTGGDEPRAGGCDPVPGRDAGGGGTGGRTALMPDCDDVRMALMPDCDDVRTAAIPDCDGDAEGRGGGGRRTAAAAVAGGAPVGPAGVAALAGDEPVAGTLEGAGGGTCARFSSESATVE
jgi:hypothetical protein